MIFNYHLEFAMLKYLTYTHLLNPIYVNNMHINSKGQVTIPHKFRIKFDLLPYTEIEFKECEGMLCIVKVEKARKKSSRQSIKLNKKPD